MVKLDLDWIELEIIIKVQQKSKKSKKVKKRLFLNF